MGGVVDPLGDLGLINVGGQIPRFVIAHPLIDVVQQAILRSEAEKFAPRHAVRDCGADIRFQPALDEFPTKFVSEFKVQDYTGLDGVAGHVIEVVHELDIVALGQYRG